MRNARNPTRFCWIAGLVLVGIGVALKRLIAPATERPIAEAWCAIAGIVVVSIGLGVIAYGISRRRLRAIAAEALLRTQSRQERLPS